MSEHAAPPQFEVPSIPSLGDTAFKVTGYWWVLLLSGIARVATAVVILQFNDASVATVGILVGMLFLALGIETVSFARLDVQTPSAWALAGAAFLVSAGICFASPADTFAGLADVLGVLFLLVGIWWMVRAFLERAINSLWWLGLISGFLMTTLAFWTSGQFFMHRAYVLLVFAGIWALIEGTSNIVRGFELRRVHEEL